tara:strand:- start:6895 stop:8313 length:1419 start_codon:yes stop_codon:yes gene_type:complete
MSGFNSNYFNRHLINDMRNALNSVFNEAANPPAPETSPIERPQGAARRNPSATNKTRDLPRAGEINTDSNAEERQNGRPRSINNADGSFNISPAAQAQAQSNRNPETAESSPRKRYVNPNSPEGRVDADVRSGKLPASFGKYQGNRLPMDLAKEREDAGNAAFDASVKTNLDIDNASVMSRSDLESKAGDVRRQDTRRVEGEVAAEDDAKNDPMPNDAPGSNTPAMRVAKEIERGQVGRFAQTTSTPATPAAKQIDNSGEVDRQRNRDYDHQKDAQVRPSVQPAVPAYNPINTSKMTSGERDAANMLNDLNAPAAQRTDTPAQPTAQPTVKPVGTPAAPAGRERMITANARADFAKKMLEISTGNTRPVSLGRDARENNSARKRIYKQERDEQAAQPPVKYGEGRSNSDKFVPPQNPRSSNGMADSDLQMWNGTIGPNGGQRATPAGSKKPTLKVESTLKPKTPPQTFFPMR